MEELHTGHLVGNVALLAVVPQLDVAVTVGAAHDPSGVAAGAAFALVHLAVEVVVVPELDPHRVTREEVVGVDDVEPDAALDARRGEHGDGCEGPEELHDDGGCPI